MPRKKVEKVETEQVKEEKKETCSHQSLIIVNSKLICRNCNKEINA